MIHHLSRKMTTPIPYVLILTCLCLSSWVERPQAQESTRSQQTDPKEAHTINSLLDQWGIIRRYGINPNWNISGNLCTGWALDSSKGVDDMDFNPYIQCDCSSGTCHITKFRVYNLDALGVLPEFIGNLTHITFLKLDQNYLSGPLPVSLGKLTNLTLLSLAMNDFSGTIPKELGALKNLDVLSLGVNNFSGPLPPEIGKLPRLRELYVNSAGLSGPIPSTFANLTRLEIVVAMDNQFTGKIPSFIGNWKELRDLRLFGNSFEGPIPSSFSSLINLQSLRLGDLSNASSSLGFIRDMKNLSMLLLRNALISDVLPSNMEDYPQLLILDLGFNNISGSIPNSLFKLGNLKSLFLGNNSLSGELPTFKSSSLENIDLSYNQLTGKIPSWMEDGSKSLYVNLVANSLQIDSTSYRLLSKKLNCLQRGFPCKRSSHRSSLAINCGGNATRYYGVFFQEDNVNLGPASYHVAEKEDWAVSSTGLFLNGPQTDYILTTDNTIEDEFSTLYKSVRRSPTSLRYYGLGLENGNYSIDLLFSEIEYPNNKSWLSFGKRVFDIYIQGILYIKDFNIKKEAGGLFKPIKRKFNVTVSQNYLEIHLFWAGQGTSNIPSEGRYGPSISAIRVTPNFKPFKKKNIALAVGIVASVVAAVFICLCVFFFLRRKLKTNNEYKDLVGIAGTFSYAELRTATEEFDAKNKLGEGGFGSVYKGRYSDGRIVAVKQLSVITHHGKRQFIAEVGIISSVQHRNLVRLYGCCIESDKPLLVYEYLENKSLDQAVFGNGLHLDWLSRYKICLGTARGLAYLHEESNPRIIHRDIKASNILLDAELNPKISDFGLAKLYDDKKTHITTNVVAGTRGYLAPEYAMRGLLTEKVDVFSFGVVCFEVLSGRPNEDTTLSQGKIYLLDWAWQLHESDQDLKMMDPKLVEYDEEEAKRIIGVALLCTQSSPRHRPTMSEVVDMLTGDVSVTAVTSKPGYLTDLQWSEVNSFWSENGTSRTTSVFDKSLSSSQSSLLAPIQSS